jgi:hypothetical protein
LGNLLVVCWTICLTRSSRSRLDGPNYRMGRSALSIVNSTGKAARSRLATRRAGQRRAVARSCVGPTQQPSVGPARRRRFHQHSPIEDDDFAGRPRSRTRRHRALAALFSPGTASIGGIIVPAGRPPSQQRVVRHLLSDRRSFGSSRSPLSPVPVPLSLSRS